MTTPKRERPARTIVLPLARIARLHALAEADGITVTEMIERMINEHVAAGRLPGTPRAWRLSPPLATSGSRSGTSRFP